MTLTRRARLMKLAIARGDLLAQATLVAGEPYRPFDDTFRMFTGIKRLTLVVA